MHEISIVDGFVAITESLADMIKFIANEPSSGLFHIQQHTQNSVPNLIKLNNNIEKKSREVTLHTADSEDSIIIVRSTKESGFPLANEMIKDLIHSLAIISKKQPKRGLLSGPSLSFKIGRIISWNPATWGRATGPEQDGGKATGYISNIFRSTKGKGSSFKLHQLESIVSKSANKESSLPDKDEQSVICSNDASSMPESESCSS